jgi:hypothetical protein
MALRQEYVYGALDNLCRGTVFLELTYTPFMEPFGLLPS